MTQTFCKEKKSGKQFTGTESGFELMVIFPEQNVVLN